ncbi:hypothetical protein [Halovivax asiaticus]|nr:hypothetical protein [Halovivax asiaticus]
MRELREYTLGRLDVDHHDVARVAGLIEDPDIRELVLFASQVYDNTAHPDLPNEFWDTNWARRILQTQGTETAARAIRDGDKSTAAFLTGIPSYSRDISGVDGEDALEDWLCHDEACKLVYVAGHMGMGKTSWAVRCMQAVDRHYRRARTIAEETDGLEPNDIPEPEFATNFSIQPTGDVNWRMINNHPDLVDWCDRGSSDEVRWYWFDEASSELTAQDGALAQKVVRKMGSLVKKARKNGVNLGFIGHDRGDVHLLIRSMADFVAKDSQKRATVYGGIKDREPVDPKLSLRGIPDATWGYDTEDMAEWSWGDEEADVPAGYVPKEDLTALKYRIIARVYYTTDLSYQKVADRVGCSKGTVSNAVDRWDRESLGLDPENQGSPDSGVVKPAGTADD